MAKEYSTEQKNLLTTEIYKKISQNGIRSYSMSQLASDLQISKKTVYKYYHSKEELITMIVSQFSDDLRTLVLPNVSNFKQVQDVMHQAFKMGSLIGHTFSDGFITDLENVYPEIYKSYQNSLNLFEKRMTNWLDQCEENKVIGSQDNELVNLVITHMIPIIQRQYGEDSDLKLAEFENLMLRAIKP